MQITCPYCQSLITTRIKKETKDTAWLWCIVLCLLGCWPCACLPFCMDSQETVSFPDRGIFIDSNQVVVPPHKKPIIKLTTVNSKFPNLRRSSPKIPLFLMLSKWSYWGILNYFFRFCITVLSVRTPLEETIRRCLVWPPNTPKFCDYSYIYMTYLKSIW